MVFPFIFCRAPAVLFIQRFANKTPKTGPSNKAFFYDLSWGNSPSCSTAAAALGKVPSGKKAKGKWASAFPGMVSQCVPEVLFFFSSNLDNQIYPLRDKVMPLLVTRR